MRKINLILILTITLSFLSAHSAFGDSAPRELLGTWRMLGFIDDGQFIVFTELFPDAKIYLKIDKTITTAFIESETLNEEEIETINKELNRLISNPHKYQKIGDNTWRVEDYDGQTIEESLLGNYLCILFGSDYLGFATR